MRLDRYITNSRIIDIKSQTFSDALQEMLAVCPTHFFDEKSSLEQIHADLLKRESNITTCLTSGIAIPHVRLNSKKPYIFVLGRCKKGLEHKDIPDYQKLKFVLLLLASEKDKSYLKVLAALARVFHNPDLIHHLFTADNLQTLQKQALQAFRGLSKKPKVRHNKFNIFTLKQAEQIARGTRCSTVMIFGDFALGSFTLPESFSQFKTILVTQNTTEDDSLHKEVDETILVRSYSKSRLSQLRGAILIALTRGIIDSHDKICCVGGIPQSNQLDSIVVVDIEREFQTIFSKRKNILPDYIKPEVLERVLAIATDLAIEGREGRSIGAFFVIGNTADLLPFVKPLVLNPFYGYKEEDKNILDPFMDETIKEFSCLDGAFIIRGDGVLESAGTLVNAPSYNKTLPSGLGTRHAAAIAISSATACIAITVSASTGQVTLFKRGEMLPLYDKLSLV